MNVGTFCLPVLEGLDELTAGREAMTTGSGFWAGLTVLGFVVTVFGLLASCVCVSTRATRVVSEEFALGGAVVWATLFFPD